MRPGDELAAITPRDLFARYLDLSPLRGRPRGKVRCVFHQPDRHPSLDVDLERGLFICRSCGASGGLKRFAALVGELTATSTPRREVQVRPRSVIEEARAEALAAIRCQAWARAGVAELYAASDVVRGAHRRVGQLRRVATALGRGARAWNLLATAAALEASVYLLEIECDELEKMS